MMTYFKFGRLKNCLAIIVLLIIGFLIRFNDLGAQSFWFDETISSIAAIAILEKGSPVFSSGHLYSRGILNTVSIAASFKIFGINEFAGRLPSVLFGTLMILLVYLIGLKWGNKRIGIIAAILVTFSIWEIAWSRQARMYQQLQFFYILSLYLFYEFVTNKNLKNGFLVFFSVLCAIMSHVFAYALIVVFLIYMLVSILKEQRSLGNIWNRTFALLVLILISSLALSYYMGVIQSVMNTDINYYDTYIYLLKNDLGLFLFIAVPGGTVLVNKDWKKGLLLISALLIPLYFIFFHVLLLGTRYLYFVIPILFILIGFFLDFIADYMGHSLSEIRDSLMQKKVCQDNTTKNVAANIIRMFRDILNIKNPYRKILNADTIIILFLLIAMYLSPAFTFTPNEEYNLGVNAPQSNFKDAYMYVNENMQADDVIVSAWTAPSQFYLGKSDYWLAFNVVGKGPESFLMGNSTRDIYTNATAIFDVDGLKEVVEQNERGWIVVDRLGWYKLRPSMRQFIAENLTTYVNSGQRNAVNVYGWENETKT